MTNRRRFLALLVIGVSTLSIAQQSTTPTESEPAGHIQMPGDGPSDSSTEVSKPDYSKEAFVVDRWQQRYRFENDGTGRSTVSFRVRVQTEAGVQNFGQLRFGYNSANDRMEIVYVRVTKPDGSIVTAGADSIQDLSGVVQQAAPVYTDYREKHVTVPGLRPGDMLECEVTTTMHTALAPGQFWTQYDFNQTSIVLDEQLESISQPHAPSS
jgi:hypothetical protein